MDSTSFFFGSWRRRRVAITGATGFVGHHVAQALQRKGAKIIALVRPSSKVRWLDELGIECVEAPLEQPEAMTRAMADCEMLLHVAGRIDFRHDWERMRRVNVGGTEAVLQAARAAGIRRVIHTSSIVTIGASRHPAVLDEGAKWNLGDIHSPYATTKREAEEVALAANSRDLEVVVVNPGCVIGPDDHGSSAFGKMVSRFWKRKIPVHVGGGNNIVDVRDVAEGHLLAAERGRPGDRYILGGENHSTEAFFQLLCQTAGQQIKCRRLPVWFARGLAGLAYRLNRSSSISPSQIQLASMYHYYSSAKAADQLGYEARPLMETLAGTFQFWCGPPTPAVPTASRRAA